MIMTRVINKKTLQKKRRTFGFAFSFWQIAVLIVSKRHLMAPGGSLHDEVH